MSEARRPSDELTADGVDVYPLAADFTLAPIVSLVSAALDAEGERLWREMKGAAGHLFDGSLLDVAEITAERISVRVVSYRAFLVDRARGGRHIKPLAVSGFVARDDRLLVGRRPEAVTQYPGFWEAPPSGGVEWLKRRAERPLDALFKEYAEELGPPPADAEVGEVFLVYDRTEASFDVCFEIRTRAAEADILVPAEGAGHYSELAFAPAADVLSRTAVVPTTRTIARRLLARGSEDGE